MKKKTKSLIVSFALAFTLLFSVPAVCLKNEGATAFADNVDTTTLAATGANLGDFVQGKDTSNKSTRKPFAVEPYSVNAKYVATTTGLMGSTTYPVWNSDYTATTTPSRIDYTNKGAAVVLLKAGHNGKDSDQKNDLTEYSNVLQTRKVDLSDNTKDVVLFEWAPIGNQTGNDVYRNIGISISDGTNWIGIQYVNTAEGARVENYNATLGINQTSITLEKISDDNPVSYLCVTTNSFSSSWGGIVDATAETKEFGVTPVVKLSSSTSLLYNYTYKIYYDKEDKAIYHDIVKKVGDTYAIVEKQLIRDLDATDVTNGNQSVWSGFSGNNVTIKVAHASGGGGPSNYGVFVGTLDGIKMACDDDGYILDSYQVKEGGVVSGSAYNKPADVNVVEGSSETLSLPTRKDGASVGTENWTVKAIDADGSDVTGAIITGLGTDNAYQENATITPTRGTTRVTFTKGTESVTQNFIVDGLKQYKLSAKVGENNAKSTVTVNGAAASTDYVDLAETGAIIRIVESEDEKLTSIKVGGVEKKDYLVNGTLTLTYAELKYKTDIACTFSEVYKMTLMEGESTLGVITAAKGNKFLAVDADAICKRNGYTYTIKSDGSEYDFDTAAPDKNVDAAVEYTAIGYTLNVEGTDGTDYKANMLPDKVTVETDLTLPSLTKNGYTFAGWYTDASYVHKLSDGTFANAWSLAGSDGKIQLYARLTVDVYTIEYVTNGGTLSGDYDYEYTIESTTHKLPSAAKKGYSFDGWYDGEKKVDETYDWSLGNKTFTARYELTTYTVTFENADAVVTTGNYTIDGTTALSFPTDVTKERYTLKGWSYNGEIYTADSFDYDIAADITLIAEWEATKYSVTYEGVDGAVWGEGAHTEYITIADKPAEGEKLELKFSAISKAGYTFGGWMVLNGSSYDAITGNEIEFKDAYLADGGLTLKPVWNAITYTVTLNVMGGQLGTEPYTTSFTVEDTTIALPSASIAGLEFMGWYTSMNGFEADKVEAGAFTFPASDLTLYAKYDSANVDITYMVDGKIFEKVNVVKYGTVQKLTKTPVKAGYSFIGWYNGDSVYIFGALATDDVTLTAKFEALEYTIVLEGNGAELENTTVTFSVETTQLTLPTPEREGYSFDGWYLDGQKIDASTFNATKGNKKLEARWIENATGETTAESCGTEAVGLLAVVLSALAAALVIKRK